MATTFLEPGGDATFNVTGVNSGGYWSGVTNISGVATDFVHTPHLKSIPFTVNTTSTVAKTGILADAGSRISIYVYLNVLPTTTAAILVTRNGVGLDIFSVRITSGGVLQLWNTLTGAQIGSNGSTVTTGKWIRLSVAYTLTSTSVNRIELFKNGISDISVTNATLTRIVSNQLYFGNLQADSTLDLRISDIYVDNSSSLTDTGNIWVTAKRPFTNGTTNNFNVQIGIGGSGYGSGHTPQVNERPLSTANGWSVVAVGVTTEEYNIEGNTVGDMTIPLTTIVDYLGWVSASSVTSETAQIIVNNVTSNISLTSTSTLFTKIAGSTIYPSGTGTDIGIITSATATTVGLYECGIVIAFIPSALSGGFFNLM